jgi:hypothetical protein
VIDDAAIRRLVLLTAVAIALPTCGGCVSPAPSGSLARDLGTAYPQWERHPVWDGPEHVVPERVEGGIVP